MKTSRISVILPNYNHAHYIEDALEALINQTVRPFEIIIIDDGSKDNSVEVIEKYTRKYDFIQLIRNPSNIGFMKSFNKALQLVSGAYLYSGASDDIIHPTLFEKSLKLLNKHPQAGFCTSEYANLFPNGITEIVRVNLNPEPVYFSPQDYADIMRSKWELSVPTGTAVWRMEAFKEQGGYIHELKWHCDWFVAHVAAFRYGICYIPEVLQTFRILEGGTSQAGPLSKPTYKTLIFHIIKNLFKDEYKDVKELFKIPSVLSRLGFLLLEVLTSREKYWEFLSPELIENVLKYEQLKVDLGVTQAIAQKIERNSAYFQKTTQTAIQCMMEKQNKDGQSEILSDVYENLQGHLNCYWGTYCVQIGHQRKNNMLLKFVLAYVKKTWQHLGQAGKNGQPLRVLIFGAGLHTQWLYGLVSNQKPAPVVVAVIDDNPTDFLQWGMKAIRPEEVDAKEVDAVVLSTDCIQEKLEKRAREVFKDKLKIIDLYKGLPPGPYPKHEYWATDDT